VRSAALQGFDMHEASGAIGFPTPATLSSFPTEPAVLLLMPSPARLRKRVHPLVSFTPLQSPAVPRPPRVFRPWPLGLERLPWGCVPSSRHHRAASMLPASQSRSRFRPRRFSRPRRLAPPLGLWVCFTPQPRPGFALQGFPLAHSRFASSASRALSLLTTSRYRQLPTGATRNRPNLRAFIRARVRCRRASV